MSSRDPDQPHLIGAKPGREILRNPAFPTRRPRKRFKALGGVNSTAGKILLTPSDIREEAESLRELLLWDLREQGYRLREIAGVLGITRQRVSQIETRMIHRAVIAKICSPTLDPRRIAWKKNASYVQLVTSHNFERRLDALNAFYGASLKRIVKRLRKFQKGKMVESHRSSLFAKVWPYIERYEDEPFSLSKLITDFPDLAREPYVSQLLSRLRSEGVLRTVGSVRLEKHNRSQVLMVRTGFEASVSGEIDKMASLWGMKLQELEASYRYRSIRPNLSLRDHIRAILRNRTGPTLDFEKALAHRREDLIPV